MSEIGVEVDYLSINTRKHFADDKTLHEQFGFLHSIKTYFIDTSVKPFPALFNLFGSGSYNIARFVDEGFRQMILRQCAENAYDIIHFEGLFVADYVKDLGTKAVKLLRQHNIEYKIWHTLADSLSIGPKRWYTRLLAKRLEQYEKAIHGHFDVVVSITEDDRLVTVNEMSYKGKTAYIPAGVSISGISAEVDYKSVYHIGSMEWLPNQEAMKWFKESVWPLVVQKDQAIQFYMGGKNMPETFRSYEQGHFHVMGEITNLDEFVSDKSILAVPLKSGSGIRIKTLEAMVAGKAVVSTSIGAGGLEIKSGKHCLIADTPEAFAEALVLLCRDIALRNEIAENGRAFAMAHFGNASVSNQWLELYGELIRK